MAAGWVYTIVYMLGKICRKSLGWKNVGVTDGESGHNVNVEMR